MDNNTFAFVLTDRMLKMRQTLDRKGDEYATEDDRLYNFKRAAAMLRTTPEKALLGMMVKHLVSVFDMVERDRPPSLKEVDEKIGDAINYLVLLDALFLERRMQT